MLRECATLLRGVDNLRLPVTPFAEGWILPEKFSALHGSFAIVADHKRSCCTHAPMQRASDDFSRTNFLCEAQIHGATDTLPLQCFQEFCPNVSNQSSNRPPSTTQSVSLSLNPLNQLKKRETEVQDQNGKI